MEQRISTKYILTVIFREIHHAYIVMPRYTVWINFVRVVFTVPVHPRPKCAFGSKPEILEHEGGSSSLSYSSLSYSSLREVFRA